MDHLEPIQVLVTATVVLAALIAAMYWGSRRRLPPPNPEKAEVWEEVTKRLGGKLYIQEGDYRVRFKWQGREAALFEGRPVVFQILGCDFGTLKVELSAGMKLTPESTVVRRPDDVSQSIVKAGDRKIAEAFLGPAVRRLLGDLSLLSGGNIEIGDRFRVSGNPRHDAQELTRFAVLCLQLAQHARLFADQSSGVRVIEAAASTAGQCQICGAELEGKLVRCSRCSTPHHADCWDYAGKCSTYGCGEKQFTA